jgi:hypothetical protein
MRLLVCGTREWPGSWEDIACEMPEVDDLTIIHGACSRKMRVTLFDGSSVDNVEVSVDMLADFAAHGCGYSVEPYPVDHRLDGPWPAAGPRRNARMLLEGKPTHGLAFGSLYRYHFKPKAPPARNRESGTGHMVRLMLQVGLPVRWVPAPNEPAQDLAAFPTPAQ